MEEKPAHSACGDSTLSTLRAYKAEQPGQPPKPRTPHPHTQHQHQDSQVAPCEKLRMWHRSWSVRCTEQRKRRLNGA